MNRYFVMLALFAALTIPASALENTTLYFVPQDGDSSDCSDTVVELWAHAPYGINTGEFAINYDDSCVKIVDVEYNSVWMMTAWNETPACYGPGYDWIDFWKFTNEGPGDVWICNITIRCIDPECDYCKTHLNIACGVDDTCKFMAANESGQFSVVDAINGIFTCGSGAPPPAETFSKPLYNGWNLISLPLVPEDNSASAVLSTVSYDAVYRYDATSKQFESIESADAMNPGTGYFVHATEDCTWEYSGTPHTSMDISLKQGLNMVGWLNCSKNVGDVLSPISDYYYVARWDATAEKFEVHNPMAPAAFNDDFMAMDRGIGYFISTKQDCTLSESC